MCGEWRGKEGGVRGRRGADLRGGIGWRLRVHPSPQINSNTSQCQVCLFVYLSLESFTHEVVWEITSPYIKSSGNVWRLRLHNPICILYVPICFSLYLNGCGAVSRNISFPQFICVEIILEIEQVLFEKYVLSIYIQLSFY